MTNLAKLTARQNAQYHYMMEVMRRFEWDMHNKIEQSGRIPPEWHEIAKDRPTAAKVRVNLTLEADVLKFFKSLGAGYGPRINLVLKSFMHARLAGVIEGAETLNHYKERSAAHDGPKPQFGEMARMLGEDWDDAPEVSTPELRKARSMEVLRRVYTDRDGEA